MSSMRRNPVTGFPEPYDDGFHRRSMENYEGTGGPMAPPSGFLPGNPVPSDYNRTVGFDPQDTRGEILPGSTPGYSLEEWAQRQQMAKMRLPSNMKRDANGNLIPNNMRQASDLRGIEIDRQMREVGYSDMNEFNAASKKFGEEYDARQRPVQDFELLDRGRTDDYSGQMPVQDFELLDRERAEETGQRPVQDFLTMDRGRTDDYDNYPVPFDQEDGGFNPPIAPSGPMVPLISQPQERTATGITSLAPEGSFQAQFLKLQADNPNDPRYAGEVPDYVSPENLQLAADNPNDPRYNQGIMGQAPAGMSDPNMMDMMRSPMDRSANYQSPSQPAGSPFGGNFSSSLAGGNSYGPVGPVGGFGGGTSGYGAMGTGMSAGGGIMSMANPMQAQMSMMPQQMMQQGGYAPQPQQQSLYGTQTGSQNNQQSLYGSQHNSPFAGASRGYYA